MRGVESAGMLCSARELGLSVDHSGLLELSEVTAVG
jgi:phenylalanyl-tRNA synthetase beta chain